MKKKGSNLVSRSKSGGGDSPVGHRPAQTVGLPGLEAGSTWTLLRPSPRLELKSLTDLTAASCSSTARAHESVAMVPREGGRLANEKDRTEGQQWPQDRRRRENETHADRKRRRGKVT